MKNNKLIANYLNLISESLYKLDASAIDKAIQKIEETITCDGSIYIMGNGGSAATASHMRSDLINTVGCVNNKRINVFCLTDNISTVTAIANDFSYDLIFKKQLETRIKYGDLLIAISGSGNSKNILEAVEYANTQSVQTIAMTGFDGGKLKQISQINLNAPVNNMQIAEDLHLLLNHLITYIFTAKDRSTQNDY